jgi:hypothetical protein
MPNEHAIPYVPAVVIGGRLVRLCPECKQEIGERTDEDGIVSDPFAEHYTAEHREQEPERQRCYVWAGYVLPAVPLAPVGLDRLRLAVLQAGALRRDDGDVEGMKSRTVLVRNAQRARTSTVRLTARP